MNRQYRLAAVTLLGIVTALASGCGGESKVKVTGKVLMKGQPLSVSKATKVKLTFTPDVEKPVQTYSARFDHATGQYEIEVPEGRYRVICVLMDTENNQRIPTATKAKELDVNKPETVDIDVTP